ncbi:MAG: ThuA domain-containing protein [Puniceicoccaceae bacterium]|nr:ThuA domain-containing protein [Puniceicoccaceae bacterium]
MMRKSIPLLSLCALAGFAGALIAEPNLDALKQALKDLRQQDHELWKQKNAVQKQIHQTQADIRVLENADLFDAAVEALQYQRPKKTRTVLVYSRTKGFRHDSIPYGVYALTELGKRTGTFEVVATEDPAVFSSPNFMEYDGVIMLNTTGNDAIPKGEARDAFEAFLKQGKGLIGIHAATDCHRDWPNYLAAMGGLFDGHPWGANSVVTLYNEEPEHPICKHISTGDTIRDEIYQYRDDEYFTRDKLRILLSLDLSGEKMKKGGMKRQDNDYAVSWIRAYESSRVFYSNLGHNNETFYNPMALQHFLNGIQFALGDLEADARPSAQVGNGKAQPLPAGF